MNHIGINETGMSLNFRTVSPNVKKSPLLSPKSKKSPGPVRKRIAMDDIDDISSSVS